MTDTPRTTQSILEAITDAVTNRIQWDANTWLEAATDLNALSSNENDLVAELSQKCSKLKLDLLNSGKTAAFARIAVEAQDEYKELQKQKALVERIKETIRLAKHMARLKNEELYQGK